MREIKIQSLNEKGSLAIRSYVDSVLHPTYAQKLKNWQGKKIAKMMYNKAGVDEPQMIDESYDEVNFSWLAMRVRGEYEGYADVLIDTAKKTYLNVLCKYNCSEKDFSIEVH